jgi:hypothetical protein
MSGPEREPAWTVRIPVAVLTKALQMEGFLLAKAGTDFAMSASCPPKGPRSHAVLSRSANCQSPVWASVPTWAQEGAWELSPGGKRAPSRTPGSCDRGLPATDDHRDPARAPARPDRDHAAGRARGRRVLERAAHGAPRRPRDHRADLHPTPGNRKGKRPGWTGGRYTWMRQLLKTDAGSELYRKRKKSIEPARRATRSFAARTPSAQ